MKGVPLGNPMVAMAGFQDLSAPEVQSFLGNMKRAEGGAKGFADVLNATGHRANRQYAHGLGQISLQAQDVFVQLGGGVDIVRTLSQQMPQVLSNFGTYGALAGVAFAATGMFTKQILEALPGLEGFETRMNKMTEALETHKDDVEAALTPLSALRREYGDLADEISRANEATLDLSKADLEKTTDRALAGFQRRHFPIRPRDGSRDRYGRDRLDEIAGDFGLDRDQAAELAAFFDEIADAKGDTKATVEAFDRLRAHLDGLESSTRRGGRAMQTLKEDVVSLAKSFADTTIDHAARHRTEIVETFDPLIRDLEELEEKRRIVSEELAEALADYDADPSAANGNRVASLRRADIAANNQYSETLDAEGRLQRMVEMAETLRQRLTSSRYEDDDGLKRQLSELIQKLIEARNNVEKLNNSDLSGLENAFTNLGKAIPDLPGTIVDVYGQYARTRHGSDLDLRAKNAQEAASRGILDLIGFAEGTDKGRGYNETLDYGRWTGGDKNLTLMTLNQIIALQGEMLGHAANRAAYGDGKGSSALGRFQIVRKTLRGLIEEMGLSGNELFDKRMQDRMAEQLLRRRQGQGLAGLRNEWEGLRNVNDDVIVTALQNSRTRPEDPGVRDKRVEAERAEARATREAEREAAAANRERIREAERLLEVREDLLETAERAVDNAELESELVGKSAAEQARLRTEYRLTQRAKAQGIDLTEKLAGSEKTYAEVIRETAEAVAQEAAAQEKLRVVEIQSTDLVAEQAQLQRQVKDAILDSVTNAENLAEAWSGVRDAIKRAAWEAILFNEGPFAGVLGGEGGGLLGGLMETVFGGLFGGGGVTASALGNAFSGGNVVPFAAGGVFGGGIVFRPTHFPMPGRKIGLMGEAGPEAIMPLSRGPDGKLGVHAAGGGRSVNITMNISTPDVGGFQRSQAQIARGAARALGRFREF